MILRMGWFIHGTTKKRFNTINIKKMIITQNFLKDSSIIMIKMKKFFSSYPELTAFVIIKTKDD